LWEKACETLASHVLKNCPTMYGTKHTSTILTVPWHRSLSWIKLI